MDFKTRLESVSQLPTTAPAILSHAQTEIDTTYSWTLYYQHINGKVDGILATNKEKYVFHYPNSQEGTPWHFHDFIEIGYVIEGELLQVFETEKLLFKQGDLFMIGRNVSHYEMVPDTRSLYFYLLLPSYVFNDFSLQDRPSKVVYEFVQNSLADGEERYDNLLFRPKTPSNKASRLLACIADEIEQHRDGYQYFVKGYLIRLFGELFHKYDMLVKPAGKEKFRELIYREVDSYMREHYADMSLEDLNRVFHYNFAYFNRLIQTYSGHTFKQHLQKIRLERAAQLLRRTNSTIEQIAKEVGYHNLGFFYRLFKEEYGMLPLQFRQSNN